MEPPFTILQLARAAGVRASTVRYCERIGLLEPDCRGANNYRLFGEAGLLRLRFIRAAQANGFKLADVAALLDFRDGDRSACEAVQELIRARLGDVEGRMAELRGVRAVLRSSLRTCHDGLRNACCPVLEGLERSSASRASAPWRRAEGDAGEPGP